MDLVKSFSLPRMVQVLVPNRQVLQGAILPMSVEHVIPAVYKHILCSDEWKDPYKLFSSLYFDFLDNFVQALGCAVKIFTTMSTISISFADNTFKFTTTNFVLLLDSFAFGTFSWTVSSLEHVVYQITALFMKYVFRFDAALDKDRVVCTTKFSQPIIPELHKNMSHEMCTVFADTLAPPTAHSLLLIRNTDPYRWCSWRVLTYQRNATWNHLHKALYALKLLNTVPWLASLAALSWVSRSHNSDSKNRFDCVVEFCARKCTAARDCDTTNSIIRVYMLLTCLALCHSVTGDFHSAPFWIVCAASWASRPTSRTQIRNRNLTLASVPNLILRIQQDKECCGLQFQKNRNQEIQMAALQRTLDKCKASETSLKKSCCTLQQQGTAQDRLVKQLQNQVNNIGKIRQNEKALNAQLAHEQLKATQLNQELNNVRISCARLREEKMEAQFDMELTKCTSVSHNLTQHATISAFAAPFVIVLVDGDAYSWASWHFTQGQHRPGVSAARAIKVEVQKHLMDHQDRIPLQSRIVTRVFQNVDGAQGGNIAPGFRARCQKDFLVDFSSSVPLFDFIDSGQGKERVDSKIQETVHLFIANPSCYAIFLAAATDNGFARLLEQYACDPAARDKIVLVHPGYIIREIEALNLHFTSWPSVFHERCMPVKSRQKAACMALKEQRSQLEKEVAAIRLVVEGLSGLGMFHNLSHMGPAGSCRLGLRMAK